MWALEPVRGICLASRSMLQLGFHTGEDSSTMTGIRRILLTTSLMCISGRSAIGAAEPPHVIIRRESRRTELALESEGGVHVALDSVEIPGFHVWKDTATEALVGWVVLAARRVSIAQCLSIGTKPSRHSDN